MADGADRTIHFNAWARELYEPSRMFDYNVVYGGRGSSKTYEISQALIYRGHREPLRIGVAREHLKSIDESAKPELEARAKRLGLLRPDCYKPTKTSIDHSNGTHIFFIGLSKVSEEDIKGLAMVDVLWIEEAHTMSHRSWELIRPTIRKDGAIILASYNPRYRTDAIWQFTEQSRNDPSVWIRNVNWRDNRFFTERNNRDRLRDKKRIPERYPHIWEGQPDDVSAKRKVLPFALLQLCVDAYPQRPPRGAFRTAGLDVADTGDDLNSYAARSGPELFHLESWRGSLSYTPSHTARRAARRCQAHGAGLLLYDAGGPGAAIRGPLNEYIIAHGGNLRHQGCHFGGKVQAEDVSFIRGRNPRTQKQYFFNWAAQAGWNVRLRADMTQRLMAGESVDPHRCLFVNPQIAHLTDVLAQLAQPEWTDRTGKLKIEKQPREPGEAIPPSPDDYDSTILAYSPDAKRGLRRPG